MPGLTDDGFAPRAVSEIVSRLRARLESDPALAGVNLRSGPVATLIEATGERLAELWAAAERLARQPSGVSLDRLAALTGTSRRPASRSLALVQCTLDGMATLPAGSIVAVDGRPDVQFRSVEAATNDSETPAQVDAIFASMELGPVPALAGSLTVIVTPVAGWTAATNPGDATLGRNRADDAELREQRRVELPALGRGTLSAIRAAVARVDGDSPDDRPVREVRVYENVTSGTVSGRPPKSIEVVVWDGDPGEADDDKIAQAIWASKAPGILAHGDGESGMATDPETGEEHAIAFTRATPVQVYVDATVILARGAAASWETTAKAALAAHAQASLRVGRAVYATQLVCALLDLPEVESVTELFVGTTPSPSASSVAIAATEIGTVDSGDVTLAVL